MSVLWRGGTRVIDLCRVGSTAASVWWLVHWVGPHPGTGLSVALLHSRQSPVAVLPGSTPSQPCTVGSMGRKRGCVFGEEGV